MCWIATMHMGKKMKIFRGALIGCWKSELIIIACILCTQSCFCKGLLLSTHILIMVAYLINGFCRDLSNIVLVHYREVQVCKYIYIYFFPISIRITISKYSIAWLYAYQVYFDDIAQTLVGKKNLYFILWVPTSSEDRMSSCTNILRAEECKSDLLRCCFLTLIWLAPVDFWNWSSPPFLYAGRGTLWFLGVLTIL